MRDREDLNPDKTLREWVSRLACMFTSTLENTWKLDAELQTLPSADPEYAATEARYRRSVQYLHDLAQQTRDARDQNPLDNHPVLH